MKSIAFKYLLSEEDLKFKFSSPSEIEVVYLTKKTFSVIENFCIEVRFPPTVFKNIKSPEVVLANITLAMENNAASYWEDKKDIIASSPFNEILKSIYNG